MFEELFAKQPRVEFEVELSREKIDAFETQGFTLPRAIPIERPWIGAGREAWDKRSL